MYCRWKREASQEEHQGEIVEDGQTTGSLGDLVGDGSFDYDREHPATWEGLPAVILEVGGYEKTLEAVGYGYDVCEPLTAEQRFLLRREPSNLPPPSLMRSDPQHFGSTATISMGSRTELRG